MDGSGSGGSAVNTAIQIQVLNAATLAVLETYLSPSILVGGTQRVEVYTTPALAVQNVLIEARAILTVPGSVMRLYGLRVQELPMTVAEL